jgi:alkylation response protein AidB-like acyl-CoA dehydrogenase
MHFQLPEDIRLFQNELREFFTAEIRPIADRRDSQGPLTREELKEMFQKLKPINYMKYYTPEKYGGIKTSFLRKTILAEEHARVWPALAATIDTHAGCHEYACEVMGEKMGDRFITQGQEGDVIFCDMMSEPESGSDTRNLKTTAILDGDHFVVNGRKMWQTNGPWADFGILTAVYDPAAYAKSPREGVFHLLAEKAVSPWKVRDLPFVGLRAGTTGLFEFENMKVPKDNIMMPDMGESGYVKNLIVRGWARVDIAAMGLGIMQAALEDSIEYAKNRVAFGKPIGGHQLIQQLIAEMKIDLDASRMLVYRAAEMMDNMVRCDMEQNMCKAFTVEAGKRVADKCVQIFGGRGLTTEEGFRAERYYRDAVMGGIAEGTQQILKLVVARRLLGIQAFS